MSKKKIIATSVLSLAMCGSVITGATYALFTSESETNVSINAGNVKLVATLNLTKTSSMGVDMPTGTFENGGTVSIDEGTITLERMTPGDKAEFEILLDNQSNVNIQYQTIVKQVSDTGLFDGLEIMIEGEEFTTTKVSDWVSVAANAQPADSVIEVSVALPEGAGNEYQGTSTQLSVAVNAVQGNATTTNPDVNTTYIYTASDLVAFAKSVNEGKNTYAGKTVMLMNDIDLANQEWDPIGQTGNVSFAGIFDGNGHKIKNLYVDTTDEEKNGVFASGLFGWIEEHTNSVQIKNVTVDGANINGNYFAGGIVGYINGSGAANVIDNCHVINATVYGGKYDAGGTQVGGIVGSLWATTVTNCSVKDSTLISLTLGEYDTVNEIAGWVGANATLDETNAYENVTISRNAITSAVELFNFATFANQGNSYSGETVVLLNDIDLENKAWTAISNFAGTFDGQDYTISNMTTRLFNNISGTVKNLKVANVNVAYTANLDGGSGFTRYMSGTVENCEFSNITVSTTARGKWMAGLFSEVSGKITGCTVNGVSVIAQDNNSGKAYIDSGSGAFAGIVKGGSEITDCTLNNVVITADEAFTVGGVFGKVGQENQASITLKNITVNGLTMTVGNTVVTSYATIQNIGGFIGQCDYRTNDSRLTIDNCHINNLDMTLVSNAAQEDPSAGFISSLNGGADITNCSVAGTINGTNEPIGIGGFLGTVGGYNAKNAYVINITDCVADVTITGNDNIFVGGFVAHAGSYKQTRTITLNFTNCEAKGSFYGAMDTNETEVSVFTDCKVDGADFAG